MSFSCPHLLGSGPLGESDECYGPSPQTKVHTRVNMISGIRSPDPGPELSLREGHAQPDASTLDSDTRSAPLTQEPCPPSRRSRARPPAHQLHCACGRSRSLWTGKETEAQRHEATCRDQQQGCAGARVFSTRLTPKCFKAWAFSRFLLCGS